jgi:sensor domain CHASE-containing protein
MTNDYNPAYYTKSGLSKKQAKKLDDFMCRAIDRGVFDVKTKKQNQDFNHWWDERTKQEIKARLEYLRGEIEAERISYGEIAELQSLAKYIEPSDVLLLEWAGVQEGER